MKQYTNEEFHRKTQQAPNPKFLSYSNYTKAVG